MKLQKQWRDYVLTLEIDLAVRKARRVRGVSSLLQDGTHFLMWDFDRMGYNTVVYQLKQVQQEYNLPAIYVVATNNTNSYHAYCFQRHAWVNALHIISFAPNVDADWVRLSGYRGFFTLRIPEPLERFALVDILKSQHPQDLTIVTEIAHYMSWFRDLDKDV